MNLSPSIEQHIEVRLQQAKDSLKEAEVCTINRSYYALFYAVSALVTLRQGTIAKHSGVIAFF